MHTQGLTLGLLPPWMWQDQSTSHAAGGCCSVGTHLLPQQLCRGAKPYGISWGGFQSQSPPHLLPTAPLYLAHLPLPNLAHNPFPEMAIYTGDTSQHDFPFSPDACKRFLHPSPSMCTSLQALGQTSEVLAE